MVLQDLGENIINCLNKLATAKQINNKFYKEFMEEIINALKSADVNQMIILKFFKEVTSKINFPELPPFFFTRKIIEREVINGLVGIIDLKSKRWDPEKDTVNVIMMAGLQNSGKTITCTKLGNFYKKQGFKVGLITTETSETRYKEQLIQNTQEFNIPYYVDFVTDDPYEIFISGIEKFKKENFNLIIIDTPTEMNMEETSLFQGIQQLKDLINPNQVILVVDGTIGQHAYSQAKTFSESVDSGSIIVTKLDSDAKGFGTFSAIVSTNSPILFYDTGEDVTTLEVFDANKIISQMLGFGDENELLRKQQEIIKRNFTFRDMYNQYQIALDDNDVMSLLDSNVHLPDGKSLIDIYKKILIVINSMNDDEIDNPSLFIEEERKNRIAKETGISFDFIQFVINQREESEKYYERIYRPRKPTKMEENSYQKIEEKLQQSLNCIAKSMDPKHLKMIGGVSGLKNMMQNSISNYRNKK